MYYFIVNPASGSGRGRTVWNLVKAELDRLGADYRFYLLSGKGEARELARSLSKMNRRITVIAVGGDGTINEIISGLTSFEHITFACIPTGSGNDFVRGLSLAAKPLEALHRILHPKEIKKINIGQTAGTSFAVSSGVCFDAAVCFAIQDSQLKKALNLFHCGKLVYLLTALWQLFTMKRQSLQIRTDAGPAVSFRKVYFAAAMNLPYEGGGFQFCPNAQPDDDCLDLIIANGISRPRALMLLPLALFGKHVGHRGIHIVRCQSATLTAQTPVCMHTDGEVPGFYKEVSFCLRPEKLPVIFR